METAFKRRIATAPRAASPLLLVYLLFQGTLSFIGWMFTFVGTIFSLIFVGNSTLVDAWRWIGETRTVEGRIVEARVTNSSENDRDVWVFAVAYEMDGKAYQTNSYGFAGDVGDAVEVEVPLAHPAHGVAVGYRSRSFDARVAFVLIFPLIGILLVQWQFRRGLQAYQVLRIGEPAEGTFVEQTETGTTVNNVPQVALHYEFAVYGQKYRAKALAMANNTHHLKDEATELVLYHPADPSRNVVVDEYFQNVRFDGNGELLSPHPLKVLAACILPLLTLVALWIGILLL